MNEKEDAAISYNPDDEPTGSDPHPIQLALRTAERQLNHRKGVKGMGMTKTPSGRDAIVVYVQDQQTLSQLPSAIEGVDVVGEITGEIRAY